MKRFFCLLILLTLLAGCVPPDTQAQPYSFKDHNNTTFHFDKRPQRVAILFSSYAEIWQLAGGRVDVTVGESVERGFADKDAILVDGGAGKTIDMEALLAAAPDLIIGSADILAQVEACQQAKRSAIPAALFRVDTFEDYLDVLKIFTDLTENPQAYQQYGTDVAEQIRDLLQKTGAAQTGEEILFIRSGSSASSAKAKRAPDHFVCTMLTRLGAHNIADDAPVLLDGLSLEEILVRDPDHIFISTMGNEDASKAYMESLLRQPGWRDLTAVQEGNVHFLPRDLFHFKPNARWAEAYRYLAQLLYPELDLNA